MRNFRTDQIQDVRGNKRAIAVQMRQTGKLYVIALYTLHSTHTYTYMNIKLEPTKYMLLAIHLNVEIEMCIDDVDKNPLYAICTKPCSSRREELLYTCQCKIQIG